MPRIICALSVVWFALGCLNEQPPQGPHTQAAQPPAQPVVRQTRSGPITPLRLLELAPNGASCDLSLWTIRGPGEKSEDPLGGFDAPCPSAAHLSWHEGRIVLSGDGMMVELGEGLIAPPPLEPGEIVAVAAFDEQGSLIACGRTNRPVILDGDKASARVNGEIVREGRPAIANTWEVSVQWERVNDTWKRRKEALVPHILDSASALRSSDGCTAADGFPSLTRASSHPVDPLPYQWENVPASEVEQLGGFAAAICQDWRWDSTRTLAGCADDSPKFRIWLESGWKELQTLSWPESWQVFEDHIRVGTSGGAVEIFSRRDGRREHAFGPNSLVIPMPKALSFPEEVAGETPKRREGERRRRTR